MSFLSFSSQYSVRGVLHYPRYPAWAGPGAPPESQALISQNYEFASLDSPLDLTCEGKGCVCPVPTSAAPGTWRHLALPAQGACKQLLLLTHRYRGLFASPPEELPGVTQV